MNKLEKLANRVDVLAQSLTLSVGVDSERREAIEIAKALRALPGVPAERLERLAGECELMEGQGLTFVPGVLARRLRALIAEAREGGKPEPMSYCPECNKQFATHSPFCPLCGGPLEDAEAPSSAGTEGPGLREALDLLRRVCEWHAQETRYPTPECIGEARRFVRRNAALAVRPVEGEKK